MPDSQRFCVCCPVMVSVRAVRGELDRFNVTDVRSVIDGLIEGGETRIVLNLCELRFIDSGGLTFLMDMRERLPKLGGEMVISSPSKLFRSTISALNAEEIFRIFPDDDAAVAYFDSDRGKRLI